MTKSQHSTRNDREDYSLYLQGNDNDNRK